MNSVFREQTIINIKRNYRLRELLRIRLQTEKIPRPKERERIFVQNITAQENYLQNQYQEFEDFLNKWEEKLKEGISLLYNSANTERKDGMEIITRMGNREIKIRMIKFVNDMASKLNRKFQSDKTIHDLFEISARNAMNALKDNEKHLQEITINKSQFNSYKAGYISNIDAFIFNESRRIKENIEAAFGTEASKKQILEAVEALRLNRNTFKLSLITHPRATFKGVIFENSKEMGFTFYKMVVPKSVLPTLSPSGKTMLLLFIIYTASQWNKESGDQETNTVGNLGLHHGSQEYYYPIASEDIDEEEEISKQQRKDLQELIEALKKEEKS